MDIQSAIEWQKAFKKTYKGMPKEVDEACDMAIEALEKTNEMKPQEVLLHSGRKGYECRNCGNELSTSLFESVYCHWCGQRLE